jgi:signal transduction histidine kinase
MPALDPTSTILVVDDDEGLLVLIEGALRAEKWNVATATSGADALAWLQKNSADLLLLDLKLHDIGGREFISALADAGWSVPFIVITGQGDERVAVDMMKRGALDYLVKDVKFIDVVPTVVRRVLDHLARGRKLAGAEESLRKRVEELTAILNAVPTPVFIAHDPDCLRITRNRAADELLRNPIGAEALLTAPEEKRPRHFKAVKEGRELSNDELPAQRAARGLQVRNFEFTLVFDDGTTRDMLGYGTPLKDVDGQPRGAVNVLIDITERKRLEREILEVTEREQRKFGHDLHDGLGQRLTGLEMFSHGLAEDLKGHAPALARQARRLNRELRETVTQARLISHSLAPIPLNGDGLVHGLSELAASTSRIPGVKCQFECDRPVCIQDVTMATHLYRIAQEAVNNALKHGKARRVDITLSETPDGLELSVKNNGQAMPADSSAKPGMGLNVMHYRAGMVGGGLTVKSGKGKGVQVTCTIRRKR